MRGSKALTAVSLLLLLAALTTALEASPPEAITYGQTLQREITPATDVDTFTFTGQTGEVITIRVTVSDGSLDPRVILDGPGMPFPLEQWAPSYVQIDYTLPANGTYTIEVSDHDSVYTGDYTLALDRFFPLTGLETVVDFGDPIVPIIDPEGKIRHYIFYALGSDDITITASAGTNSVGKVELWSPSGVFLGSTACYYPAFTGELGSAGWYHMIARWGTGSFEIDLVRNGKPLVETVLNQTTFHTGQQLQVSLHVVNGPDPQTVDVRSWLVAPNGSVVKLLTAPGQYVPADANVTIPVFNHMFIGGEPVGTYRVCARLMQPITGYTWSLDESDTFSFSP
jgi:hypothetical protein